MLFSRITSAICVVVLSCALLTARADVLGSIFLTGHDPDFHAVVAGGNNTGAQNINKQAIAFIMDPGFNPFVAGGTNKFLFVESSISVPGGHVDGESGLIASGYTAGTDFDTADASTLLTKLGELGTTYSAIVIASDFGGILTQAELDILDANSTAIIDFQNAGGGLYAMAESGNGAGLTTSGRFGFLPFVATSAPLDQAETGNTVTAFGAGIGLTNSDVNGNFSHNIFTGTFGLNIVDIDQGGETLSLAGRGKVDTGGVGEVPEPSSILLFGTALVGFAVFLRRKRQAQ